MSTASASQTIGRQRIAFGRLWWVGLLTIVASVIINIGISLLTRALIVVPSTFTPLQQPAIVFFTLIGTVGATILFALLGRFTSRPIQTFQTIAWIVLIVSLIPDVLLLVGSLMGATLPTVIALMIMHVATALVCIGLLSNLGRARA